MKKMWEKPELIVLLKNRPDESVLTGCKTQSSGITPGTNAQMCGTTADNKCNACQSRGGGIS